MKKLLLSIIAAAAFYFASSPAHATTGYVCWVDQYNYSGFGSYGGVAAPLYSSPNCAGSFLGFGYICSVNATSTVCSASSYRAYSEAQVLSQFQALLDAARLGKKVVFSFGTNCKSGGTSCNDGFNYYSN